MIHMRAFIQTLAQCSDAALVGGKAVNLGRLIRAGFRVPDGFVVTTEAFSYARDRLTEDISDEIRASYRELGGGPVAVRSSATAEDMGSASMAGQYETYLDIIGEDALLEVVQRCWASLDAPRTRAYLREHSIDLACVKMAVVVQRLIAADVSGVLFTENPVASNEMLLEASWGLGESIVSGRVQPDVLRVDRKTQRVVSATISDKKVYIAAGSHKEQPVEEARRLKPCLNGRDVYHLWQLGQHAADHFGAPQDIEWAIEAGEVYILQSRPITTHRESQTFERTLDSIQSRLRAETSAGRGPWVLHNLAETLPHPTPLTWSIMRRFMSGSGGFGIMHRRAGFEPSPAVDRDGFLELIGGRIYMDVTRAPEMFFENFPFAYDVNDLKRNPEASQAAPTLPRGSAIARFRTQRKLMAVDAELKESSKKLDQKLRNELFQDVSAYAVNTKTIDLRTLTTDWVIELWQEHEQIVLNTFAPHLFMPSLICGMAMEELKSFIRENFWNEDAEALAQLISSGGRADVSMTASAELYEVGRGTRPLETWLAEYGHRAPGEFDLASPRWREKPEAARRLAPTEDPLVRHHRVVQQTAQRVEALRARLAHADQIEFDRRIDLLRRYVIFREDGKNALMRGYDLLRDVALEAGRRLEIGDDVFFLTRDEVFDSLRVGFAPYQLIEERKLARDAEQRLSLPRVIDSAAIDGLGKPATLAKNGHGHKAFSISAGQATGTARIVQSPDQAGDLGQGYILVCPSTDPSWTPLFVNAAGLVLECGGTLSHGAVVAREMGLPAVVLPDATRLFQDGQEISVDARHGWVGPASAEANHTLEETVDPDDVRLPDAMVPPPVGRKDRRAGKIRNTLAAFWTLFLFGFFLLPQAWLRRPTFALLDALLWPIVRSLGKPATVVIAATGIALVTLLIQKYLVDNQRLLESKRRAAELKKQAESLPKNSRRRSAMLGLASPVPLRTLMAAMVPLGILLGPMVMPFIWFHERMDLNAWNAPAGTAVRVVAMVDGDWNQPVSIDVPGEVSVDSTTPKSRTLPPIRQTLERLLALYRQPAEKPAGPWELQTVPDLSRQQTAAELQAYLSGGIPPQGIAWLVRPSVDFNGRFPVNISTAGHVTTVQAVLGDSCPPAQTAMASAAGSPIREVKVFYQKPKEEQFFFRPFARLAGHSQIPFSARLAPIDIGWLWLYILTYLPVLMLIRTVLKIA